jgi:SecD/SecF fusion protein
MAIYMMFSFATIRKSVSPSVLAMVTIVTMVFDISIPAGAYGFLMMINSSITIDTVFIIAVLTNMGYSINDTIIIFDRIRENIQNKNEKGIVYGKIFDDSLRQTMRRSI